MEKPSKSDDSEKNLEKIGEFDTENVKEIEERTSHMPLVGRNVTQSSVNPTGNSFVVMNYRERTLNDGIDEEEREENLVKYLIEVISLSKTFGSGLFSKHVLNGVNFNVLPGRM